MALATLIGNYKPNHPASGADLQSDLTSLETRINAVTSEQIATGAVTQAKIPAGAVSTGQLADGLLTANSTGRAKMQDGFLTTAKIEDGAVGTDALADGGITFAKLATGIGIVQMKMGTYTGNGSAVNAVTGVGFMPDVVLIIWKTSPAVVSMGLQIFGTGSPIVSDLGIINSGILVAAIQYDADGFTIKNANVDVNGAASTYAYIAWKAI